MGEIVAAVGTCHTPYMFTRPPDENPQQLDQAGAAMQELGKVLDETKPDVILFFGADHVETFSVSCIPSFAIVAGDRAIAKFAGREHNLPIHREMAEDILNKLVVDHNFDMAYSEDAELGHAFSIPFEYVIGKRDDPGHPVLHERLRSAAADAEALRSARQGDRRDRQGAEGARGDHRERRHVALPGHEASTCTRSSISIAGSCRSSRPGNTDALLEHDRHAARRGGQHRDAQLGGDVRRDRRDRRRAHRLHPDMAPRTVHDALPAAARAEEGAACRWRRSSAASSSRTRASSSTSTRRPRRTG